MLSDVSVECKVLPCDEVLMVWLVRKCTVAVACCMHWLCLVVVVVVLCRLCAERMTCMCNCCVVECVDMVCCLFVGVTIDCSNWSSLVSSSSCVDSTPGTVGCSLAIDTPWVESITGSVS